MSGVNRFAEPIANAININIEENYYGGLLIKKEKNKCYWIIEDYDTQFTDINEWQEIPQSLYNELLKMAKT
jgi:hypothetical protein